MAKLFTTGLREVDSRSPFPTSRVREGGRRGEENYHGTTWLEYIAWQWSMNKLRRLWSSEYPHMRDAREVMNAIALVNTVVLVMTTSICVTLQTNYMRGYYQTCDMSWSDIKYTTEYPLYLSALCSSEAAVFSMLYHLIAPIHQASFRVWWRKGKYAVLLTVLLTTIATVCYLFIALTEWYVMLTTRACLEHPIDASHHGKVVFVVVSVVYILLRPKFLLPFFGAFSLTIFGVYSLLVTLYNSMVYFGCVVTLMFAIALALCVYLNHLRMNYSMKFQVNNM